MRTSRPVLLCTASALALAACSQPAAVPTEPSAPAGPPRVWPGWEPSEPDGDLVLASTDFTAGGDFPRSIELSGYGCAGENVRPELHWDGLPEGTESVVVTFTAEGGGPLNRWTLADIPTDVTNLPASAENPDVGTIATNGIGWDKMLGPCSKEGERWELWFTVYALDTTLDIPEGSKGQAVIDAGAGHVIEAAELTGFHAYEAPAG
ncbi:YbhB/YbcL family Raf kinase inhibitor-like protein [Cellulomonas sp. Leaf334]|uniref:YbhB/YbcL family Raf kinase inhibitor-like protein n=1 Tax=Cellulomonas sp. Leaf334 TaxID=1736339 RepID=UPI0006F8A3DB|nr:YbhB/YbcL family Raf kinase inhibitor-like protein [Cellulomonas sp. Leaf334]KQR07737.1 hypothetical protein ASF78_20930 [Cellulomonas sp. Leaf334]